MVRQTSGKAPENRHKAVATDTVKRRCMQLRRAGPVTHDCVRRPHDSAWAKIPKPETLDMTGSMLTELEQLAAKIGRVLHHADTLAAENQRLREEIERLRAEASQLRGDREAMAADRELLNI